MKEIRYSRGEASENAIYTYLDSVSRLFIPELTKKVPDLRGYARKIKKRAVVFEAWDNNRLIGMLAAYFNDFNSKVGFVTSLCVAEKYHSKGIAKKLLSDAIMYGQLQKFNKVSYSIGTEMKSVGEVMAIGRTFEEAVQKAIRMLNIGMYGLVGNKMHIEQIARDIEHPTDKRIFALVEAIKSGFSIDKIYSLSHVDKWFLFKIKHVVDIEQRIAGQKIEEIPIELLLEAKKAGFSDKQIAMLCGETDELRAREHRKRHGIVPAVRQIDTLAAEFPAKTNYLYVTYNGTGDDIAFGESKQVMLLGSGAYSIGSSVEFDWCGVTANNTVKKMGYRTVMVNFNPETVSTDYDVCDRLYFEELSLERVLDIYEKEQPLGALISMGGQIPNNLAMKLHRAGVKILGTSPESIDRAEDRHKFSRLCDSLAIDQPLWKELTDNVNNMANNLTNQVQANMVAIEQLKITVAQQAQTIQTQSAQIAALQASMSTALNTLSVQVQQYVQDYVKNAAGK